MVNFANHTNNCNNPVAKCFFWDILYPKIKILKNQRSFHHDKKENRIYRPFY